MKTLVLVLGILALTGSCNKGVVTPDNACTTTNPVENVKWMNDLKGSLDNGYYHGCIGTIFQAAYLQQTVYFTMITDSACEYIPGETLLNCYGQVIKTYTVQEQAAFATEVTGFQKLYTSHH